MSVSMLIRVLFSPPWDPAARQQPAENMTKHSLAFLRRTPGEQGLVRGRHRMANAECRVCMHTSECTKVGVGKGRRPDMLA